MALTADYQQLLRGWLKGHEQAQACIETLFEIVHVCDDLTDRDAVLTTARMQQAFQLALIELPRNPFYVTHFALLNGALQVAYLNWQIANRMEVSMSPTALPLAFVLRSSYTDLITLCAAILGGTEWAIQVGYESRLHASQEGLEQYTVNLRRERRQTNCMEVPDGLHE